MSARSWPFLLRPSDEPSPGDWATSAKGTRVRFADGLEAFCATSGLWNVPLGYGRDEIADAVSEALRDASYLTLFRRSHPLAEEAAERVISFTGMPFSRVLHATSGGAANDLVMKLSRQYWSIEEGMPRRLVVGLRGSYHGLTYGAHALSGDELGQAVYGVDGRDVRHVPFDDGGAALEALCRREGNRIAALVVEPVLGSGAIEVPADFLDAVQRLRAQYGFLLVADEVATGFGRTGVRFASSRWMPHPDALVLSKALTNGACAASVVVVGERIATAFDRHDALLVHGETQAGTPSSCAAIVATLDLYEQLDVDRLFPEVIAQIDRLEERLVGHPRVIGVAGRGAFRALRIAGRTSASTEPGGTEPVGASKEEIVELVERIRRAGAIVHPGPSVLQLIPAAISDSADLDRLGDVLCDVLDEQDAA
ncbi:daptide-type RiPP biosynthesis aminotransferase [Microbacterium sp. 179-I 3D3 NHS]|uniref:daptide-type RiPP biosynthesis aminotransferase n=1 Tax=Microbacterium sp. 179-I 3D3 NHS TaxID=3142382 RepID=UPI0039A3B739